VGRAQHGRGGGGRSACRSAGAFHRAHLRVEASFELVVFLLVEASNLYY
jgi:hypothetical protein